MKKLKSFIIYGVLIMLCISGIYGYYLNRTKSVGTASVSNDKVSAASTAQPTAETTSTIPRHVEDIMKKSAADPKPNPLIGIGVGDDYVNVTKAVIENAGGIKELIKPGNTVLIKPNLCVANNRPGSPLTTDYRVVNEVAKMAKEYGASRVIIADGAISGNSLEKMSLEFNKYNTIEGVEFLNNNAVPKKDCYELKPQKSMTGKAIFIPKYYMDADVVINVAKLKTHFQPDAVVTLSLKNSIGVASGMVYGGGSSKSGLHSLGLKESIVDLNRIRKPDFSIIEGIVGGEGYGPVGNDPVRSNVMFAGKDPAALDTVALTFMGFKVDEIPHVKLAGETNLGITDLSKIKINGANLNSIKMNFKRSPYDN